MPGIQDGIIMRHQEYDIAVIVEAFGVSVYVFLYKLPLFLYADYANRCR